MLRRAYGPGKRLTGTPPISEMFWFVVFSSSVKVPPKLKPVPPLLAFVPNVRPNFAAIPWSLIRSAAIKSSLRIT